MGMTSEFREFVARGNVFDLAVGVVIGAAFGKIIASLVDDVIMPPIGMVLGRVDFTQLRVVLKPAVGEQAEVAIRYGAFLNNVIQFVIVAFVIFLMVRQYNRLRRKEDLGDPAPPTEKPCPYCSMPIPIGATRCGHCTSQLAV
jgi:large conductance mechanosensitive channel